MLALSAPPPCFPQSNTETKVLIDKEVKQSKSQLIIQMSPMLYDAIEDISSTKGGRLLKIAHLM